jgi:replicative DNA helicase
VATKQEEVISAVCRNKDFGEIVGEPSEVFGPFSNIVDFMREYYYAHKETPSAQLIINRFGDVELPETTAPTKYYVEQLRSEYLDSRVNRILIKASENMGVASTEEVITKAITSLSSLEKYTGGVHDVDLGDYEGAIEHYRKVQTAQKDGSTQAGVKSGILAMDSALPNGITNGSNVLLFGYSGHTKSWAAALLAIRAWMQGRKVLYVSLEMPVAEMRDRLYTIIGDGRFDLTDLGRGDIEEDELRRWAAKEFMNSPDFKIVAIDGTKPVTPNFVRSKIDQYGSNFVVLDYAQLMSDNSMTRETTPRMMNLSREIRMLALTTDVPVVWISSVTDDDSKKRDSAPTIAQVSWSRQLEYDCTLAIAVHSYENGGIEWACRKNRNGPLFNVILQADIAKGKWKEVFDTDI